MVAVKSSSGALVEELTNERKLLSQLRDCPYVIRYLGYESTAASDGRERVLNVFMELASGGTLMDLVAKSNNSGLPEKTVRRMTRSIVGGLRRMHELGLIHCDLKLENVLLVKQRDGEFVAKVADLGVARHAEETGAEVTGTMAYWAPEVLSEHVQGKPADVWALGCVVVGMLTRKYPWDYVMEMATGQVLSLLEGEFSGEALDFVAKCFRRNPSDRATAEELWRHPFVCGGEHEWSPESSNE